jgi:enamine deaminase RidA (YjgF/YER057c/UK114 family)
MNSILPIVEHQGITRLHVAPRLSEVAIHNGVIYLAGQVAENTNKDIIGQTREVLQCIDELLSQCNSDKSMILSATIWLADIDRDYVAMNSVWDNWVEKGNTPPRATVESKLANPKGLVEIKIIAAQKPL